MNNHINKINTLKTNNSFISLEAKIFIWIYKAFGVKLPLSLYAPTFLNFIICYSLVFILGLAIGLGLKSIFLFFGFNGFDFHASKFMYIALFIVMMYIAFLEALKSDVDFRRWYCYDKEWWWYQDITSYDELKDKKLLIFLSIYSAILSIISFFIFKIEFIRFLANSIILIYLYETVKKLLYYNSLKKWKKIDIISSTFQNIEKEVMNNKSLFNRENISKQNYLEGKISYKHKNTLFVTKQIFADQENRTTLFESEDGYYINKWIQNHKEHNKIYFNPHKPYQAIVNTNVLTRSYVEKYLTLIGGTMLLWIANTYM